MNEKIRWLRNKIKSIDLDAMIISNPINIKYLTGIEAEGVLILARKENFFITDGRYVESVNALLTIEDEIIVEDVQDLSAQDEENLFLFCENVGFEENYVTYAKYKEYMYRYKINNLVETEKLIEKQRAIKDSEEIKYITKACNITDDCFEYLLNYIKIGMTEKQIASAIERFFRINGAEELAFDTIVASGSNSSMPHAVPTDRKIELGDVITIDMGCKYNGYCSDMTRTIFVGEVDEEIKKVYDLVLKNQLQTLGEMKEGAVCKNIAKMVINDFEMNDYTLIHGLGHSLGLEIHEIPNLSSKSEAILKSNMVITDEPGIYIPGKFGIRIEDTVIIGKSTGVPLTKSNKEIITIQG